MSSCVLTTFIKH